MSDRGAEEDWPPPVWNPEVQEFDPWLPQRLRDQALVARMERDIYESFWAVLAQFLVLVLRQILGAGVPDPQQVLRAEGQWNAMVDEFSRTVILPAMGSVYQQIFGPDVQYSGRPAVQAHLAAVDNRLRNVDNEVFNRVAAQVSRSVEEGWSIPETAAAIEEELSPANPLWQNRALTVARTETISALNAGRLDSFQQIAADNPDLKFQKQWLATLDHRVRDTHRRADQQRRDLDKTFSVGTAELRFPGDPRGPAKEVIQCRCTPIMVEAGREVNLQDRGFPVN